MLDRVFQSLYRRFLAPRVPEWFFRELIKKTDNFGSVTWLGAPVWQNVLDLWTMQETIAEIRPALFIETGTNRGGSALFVANLFDLMNHGRVVTVDVEVLHHIVHPRITFLVGSSTSAETLEAVRGIASTVGGPIMVSLDSDHSESHVRAELTAYAPLVTPGSYCLVQDGVIDVLPGFAGARPGPLPAIKPFLQNHPEFELDSDRSQRFLISHHPNGWLRRRVDSLDRGGILAHAPRN